MIDEQIKLQLLDDLWKNGFAQVRDAKIEEDLDSTGDEAVFVWLLLDDTLMDKDLS